MTGVADLEPGDVVAVLARVRRVQSDGTVTLDVVVNRRVNYTHTVDPENLVMPLARWTDQLVDVLEESAADADEQMKLVDRSGKSGEQVEYWHGVREGLIAAAKGVRAWVERHS